MTDYANFLEQMQQSYEQLAGMRADDASDVGNPIQDFGRAVKQDKRRAGVCKTAVFSTDSNRQKIWKCTRWNVEFFARRQPIQKERFDFPGSQLHRRIF